MLFTPLLSVKIKPIEIRQTGNRLVSRFKSIFISGQCGRHCRSYMVIFRDNNSRVGQDYFRKWNERLEIRNLS